MNEYQNRMKLLSIVCLLMVVFFTACGKTTSGTPTLTIIPTESPTDIPTVIPTSTNTPEPTPLPGSMVYPISSLGTSNPWLPLDKANIPMSVYYGFNMDKPPFDNALVRQAFAAAIDKDKIVEKATSYGFRNVTTAMTLTPPEVMGRDLFGAVGVAYDPAKAKKLLEEVGYTGSAKFPDVKLMVTDRGEAYPGAYYQIGLMIAEMWKTNLGVNVTVEIGGQGNAYFSKLQNNSFDIYQLAWGADYNDPDNFLNSLFNSKSEFNLGHFYNLDFDKLVEQAAIGGDPAKRQLMYIQAERILTEQEIGIIPLVHTLYYINP